MQTLDTTPKNKLPFEMDYNFNKCFKATVVLPLAATVMFDTSGEVVPCTTDTDYPLGTVTVPADKVGDKVTVAINARAVVRAEATVALAVGDRVSVDGVDAANNTKYKKAAAGKVAVGYALEPIAVGATGEIAIYYQPVLA